MLAFPFMLSVSATLSGADKYYLWIYPAYILAASFLAWQCYGRRTEMTWIIIILMLLTHVAMWALPEIYSFAVIQDRYIIAEC